MTRDAGRTFDTIETVHATTGAPLFLSVLEPNEQQPNLALAAARFDTHTEGGVIASSTSALAVSEDFGRTWRVLRENITQAGWLDPSVPGWTP